jgi:hypothetical protein
LVNAPVSSSRGSSANLASKAEGADIEEKNVLSHSDGWPQKSTNMLLNISDKARGPNLVAQLFV